MTLELPPEEAAGEAVNGDGANGELKLIARDDKRNPLLSGLGWTPEAVERLFKIPLGFMRARTQERAEALASEQAADTVDLALVDAALDIGRQLMEQFIAEQGAGAGAAAEASAAPAGKCPWHAAAADIVRRPEVAEAAKAGLYLNEVSLMSALEAMRKRDGGPDAQD